MAIDWQEEGQSSRQGPEIRQRDTEHARTSTALQPPQ